MFRNLIFLYLTLFFSLNIHAAIKNFGTVNEQVYRGGWLHNGEDDFKSLKKSQ